MVQVSHHFLIYLIPHGEREGEPVVFLLKKNKSVPVPEPYEKK